MALTTNLVSYWKLDESSGNAADSVGSNTLTNNGTVTYSAGKINNGADCDSGKYLSLSSPTGLPSGANARSVSIWWKTSSLTGQYLVDWGTTAAGQHFAIKIDDSTHYSVDIGGTGLGIAVPTLSINTWYHVVVTYPGSGNTYTIYHNGSLVGTISFGSTPNTGSTYICLNGYTASGTYSVSQSLDEVGIWSRALTAGEVSQIYNGNKGSQYPFTDIGISYQESANLGNDQTGTSWTVSYTVGAGANRILLVALDGMVSSSNNVSGVTYGGVAMTLVDGGQGDNGSGSAGDRYHSLWYLVNPASGANNFVISRTNNTYVEGVAISYAGVAQTTIDNKIKHTDHSNPSTTSITSVADNCWQVMSFHRSGSGSSATAGTGTTKRISFVADSNYNFFDSNAPKTPAGSTSLVITGITGIITISATIAPVPTTNIKSMDGVDYSSIKSVDGVVIASIKSLNGLA